MSLDDLGADYPLPTGSDRRRFYFASLLGSGSTGATIRNLSDWIAVGPGWFSSRRMMSYS